MAARLNRRHQDMVRQKIQASQLINRLENYVFKAPRKELFEDYGVWLQEHGENLSDKALKELESILEDHSSSMESAQVNAALGLLKKSLPDLKAVELTGDDGGPLQVSLINFADVSTKQLDT